MLENVFLAEQLLGYFDTQMFMHGSFAYTQQNSSSTEPVIVGVNSGKNCSENRNDYPIERHTCMFERNECHEDKNVRFSQYQLTLNQHKQFKSHLERG